MKLFGAVGTEFICIMTICNSESLSDIVMDYIAFGIISEVDNLIAGSVFNHDIEGEIAETKVEYPAE